MSDPINLSEGYTRAIADVIVELGKATAKFGAFNSGHEGWAVIKEELDELWDHVRSDTWKGDNARKEAIQIAAMALRYAADLTDRGDRSRRCALFLPHPEHPWHNWHCPGVPEISTQTTPSSPASSPGPSGCSGECGAPLEAARQRIEVFRGELWDNLVMTNDLGTTAAGWERHNIPDSDLLDVMIDVSSYVERFPALQVELGAAREDNERLQAALRAIEFVYMPEVSGPGDHCPSCGQTPEQGHHAECRLARALAGVVGGPDTEQAGTGGDIRRPSGGGAE